MLRPATGYELACSVSLQASIMKLFTSKQVIKATFSTGLASLIFLSMTSTHRTTSYTAIAN